MEGFPERWTTTQQVLAAVKKHATSLRTSFKEGIEYESGPPGPFPHIRILQPDAAEALISQIARDAIDGLLPNFIFQQLNSRVRDAVLSFITNKDVSMLDRGHRDRLPPLSGELPSSRRGWKEARTMRDDD